ncbi:MAG: 5-formyltetrahydrofolate cyclo-ligase [Falsihalocynthiibacter arcticus]
MVDLAARKSQARKDAFARRKLAFDAVNSTPATRLTEVLAPYRKKTLAAYVPMRTEISPLAAMEAHSGQVCVPVIQSAGTALKFALWTADMAMVEGAFGARIPQNITYVTPDVLIVPLVAFDDAGNRLGYGGGFYDRTLQDLRRSRHVVAIGLAFEAQRADELPLEATDQPLDFIVTEAKTRTFSR